MYDNSKKTTKYIKMAHNFKEINQIAMQIESV